MFNKIKAFFQRHKKTADAMELLELETESQESAQEGRRYIRYAEGISEEIADVCENLIDATYQLEDQRIEYETLGNYFDDITRIEQMPEGMRRELNDIAAKLELLSKNQTEFRHLKGKLSEDRFRSITRYEQDIPRVMKELSQMETRHEAIRRDMKHLEDEKEMQDYVTEEAMDRQHALRLAGISVAVMSAITFGVIFWMYSLYIFQIELVCMITLFVITVIYVVLYLKYRNESYEIKLAQAKKQRAITLLNKVKIKWVNSTSTLDYIYEKYGIENLRELEYLWEQYNILLRETRKFQNSLGDMRYYYEEMERVLRDAHVKNPTVWLQQTSALLDEREMVEVKHSLNVGRQNIRNRMEENEARRRNSLVQMKNMVVQEPALMEEIRDILSTYHINF